MYIYIYRNILYLRFYIHRHINTTTVVLHQFALNND